MDVRVRESHESVKPSAGEETRFDRLFSAGLTVFPPRITACPTGTFSRHYKQMSGGRSIAIEMPGAVLHFFKAQIFENV